MIFRPATKADLPYIYAVFNEIIDDMNRHGIEIWDDIYPCAFFEDDIAQNRLHLLCDGEEVVSALVLADEKDEGEGTVAWHDAAQPARYVLRFGVNVRYRRRGMAQQMLEHAATLARQEGAEALRLLVVDCNEPARKLYEKCGFQPRPGEAILQFDDGTTLHELGMERLL